MKSNWCPKKRTKIFEKVLIQDIRLKRYSYNNMGDIAKNYPGWSKKKWKAGRHEDKINSMKNKRKDTVYLVGIQE